VKTDYLPAVQSAINYIEEHLHEELSIQSIAAHSGFSQYHFHRIFTAVLGESIKDYVRKRRLMQAADALFRGSDSILGVALRSGFDSQESFTRAFKKMFGTTPGAYRKAGTAVSYVRKPRASDEMVRHLTGGITMQPKIVIRETDLAIGMGDSFTQGDTDKISQLWNRFIERIPEIRNAKPYSLGVCMASHPDVPKKAGDTFVYVAAMPVTSIDEIPEGMVACELPQSRYALFTHKGPIADIRHTVEYIWGTWIPETEYKLKDIPDYELYDDRFDPVTASGEVDIYVPIE
jgi:AraC family transcriptional regulator